eukprot:jgi/Picsp_1/2075/NSC_05540-R1_stress regulated protein
MAVRHCAAQRGIFSGNRGDIGLYLQSSYQFEKRRANRCHSSSSVGRQLDSYLESGDEKSALALVRESDEITKHFGKGRQVPKRSYTLEELRLNKIDTREFLAPEDTTLDGIRNILQGSAAAGLLAGFLSGKIETFNLVQSGIFVAFLLTVDQVANAGGVEALLVDSAARVLSPTYARRIALHEAGHFLIAYLLGILPKGYTLSSWDAFRRTRSLNIQAGTTFCDAEFQTEVKNGQLSSSSLDVFSCVALAGVATEWLKYGKAEGGLSDIKQLDNLMTALGFTQAKADDQVRFSVLNVVTLLRRHANVQEKLADAMTEGRSISECIKIIEDNYQDV